MESSVGYYVFGAPDLPEIEEFVHSEKGIELTGWKDLESNAYHVYPHSSNVGYTAEELLRFLTLRYGDYLTLELGPGRSKSMLAGIGLNERADPTADIFFNLNNGIPLPDESVEEIFSNQMLEHLFKENQIKIWNEMFRVLKPGGKMEHHVPHYLSPHAVGDPTHFTQYSETSFQYYCLDQNGRPFVESFSDYGITARFILDEFRFENGRQGMCVKMHKPAREEL